MDDRDLDRRLSQRLRAYESRLPETDAPDPRHIRHRRRLGWPAVAGVLGSAAVVGALAGIVLLNRPAAPIGEASATPVISAPSSPAPSDPASSPTFTPSPTSTPAATATPPTPTATPPADAADIQWTMAGAVGGDGATIAWDVIHGGSGYLAVGVEYDTQLPNLGPTPSHQGRVWFSADGSSWEQVSADDAFPNVALQWIATTADGAYVTIGNRRGADGSGQLSVIAPAIFASDDGSTWREIANLFPTGSWFKDFGHGPRGMVAFVEVPADYPPGPLWVSADARSWAFFGVPWGAPEYTHDLDGGAEGFALIGDAAEDEAVAPYVLGSADGAQWLKAAPAPDDVGLIASVVGDWFVVTNPLTSEGRPADAAVWSSATALEWQQVGNIGLEAADIDGGECWEYVSDLFGAGRWVFAGTTLSHPCSEGGFVTAGTQRMSADGATWIDLPFSTTEPKPNGGALVHAGAAADGAVVLVGEIDNQAGFWLGTPD